VSNGMARPLVSDRVAENPIDVGWINDGRDLAYLTNRSGSYSVWYVDLAQSTIQPLTQPLIAVPLTRIGMAVSGGRIVLPRHFVRWYARRGLGKTGIRAGRFSRWKQDRLYSRR